MILQLKNLSLLPDTQVLGKGKGNLFFTEWNLKVKIRKLFEHAGSSSAIDHIDLFTYIIISCYSIWWFEWFPTKQLGFKIIEKCKNSNMALTKANCFWFIWHFQEDQDWIKPSPEWCQACNIYLLTNPPWFG